MAAVANEFVVAGLEVTGLDVIASDVFETVVIEVEVTADFLFNLIKN